jgi:hypothetical protein
MIERVDFEYMVTAALKTPGLQSIRPVVEKELLHYDILFALDKEGLLDNLTFQGGTSLRLCYGSSRLSEDLDFAGGSDFDSQRILMIKACLEDYIGRRYGLNVEVKQPSKEQLQQAHQGGDIKVLKWQVAITTAPAQRDVPKQRIKLEVANVPAYTRIPQPLQVNYSILPDGYDDTLIIVETLDEVMTDKAVSLPNTQRYVRYRDVWDLRWLVQQGAAVNMDLLSKKISDYRIDDYVSKVEILLKNIPSIVRSKALLDELGRFLPADVQDRTIRTDKFLMFLENKLVEIFDPLTHV